MSRVSLIAFAGSTTVGSQRPRICHVPLYSKSAGPAAISLAAGAGLNLDDWQGYVLTESLGENSLGRWAAPTVGLSVARQNGKNSILEARELAGLFLFGEMVIVHSAHEQATATEHFRRMEDLIAGTPDFSREVSRIVRGKGAEAIELRTGQRILFKPRTGAGGRGFTIDLLVFDEAMILSEEARAALIPAMSARSIAGNPQTWYTGSAGDEENPKHDPLVFARIRHAATSGADGVAWFDWSVPGDDPLKVAESISSDPSMWALANPGQGVRISVEAIEHERTVGLGPREFAVERLGIGAWPDVTEGAGRIITAAQWALAAEHDRSNRIEVPVYAVDVNPDRTWSSIGVAGERADGLNQFAVVDHKRGTEWLVPRIVELLADVGVPRLLLDARSPAAALIPELNDAGVYPVLLSTEDYGNACGGFYDAIDHQTARYPAPQEDLDLALAGAQAKPLGDRWKWARKSPTSSDLTPLIAVTIALWGARTLGVPTVYSITEIAAKMQADAAAVPEVEEESVATATTPEPQNGFIRLEDMPRGRGLGLFR